MLHQLAREEVDGFQRGGIGPLQVFQDDQERASLGEPLEDFGEGPESLSLEIGRALQLLLVGERPGRIQPGKEKAQLRASPPTQNLDGLGGLVTEEREEGILESRCAGCGDCILALTGGICPVARCAKGLLNGPCGGSENGKCEVDPERDCAWALIIEQLEKKGKLQLLEEIRPPKDYQLSGWRVTP